MAAINQKSLPCVVSVFNKYVGPLLHKKTECL